MAVTLETSACKMVVAVVLTLGLRFSPAAHGQEINPGPNAGSPVIAAVAGNSPMPATQQNALVQKYCAVCHDDAHRNGGLSLQHFDAVTVEPSLAAMMVSKLKAGAMGAAGLKPPARPVEDGLVDALMLKSVGASEWNLSRTQDPTTQVPVLTASILRSVPAPGDNELYRLELTCRPGTREAEMQLTWAPNPGSGRRELSVSVDGKEPVAYAVDGSEKMGNGAKTADGTDATTGPAAAILYATHPSSGAPNLAMPLPARTLTIGKLFADQIVVFPFDRLSQPMRQELSTCFAESGPRVTVH